MSYKLSYPIDPHTKVWPILKVLSSLQWVTQTQPLSLPQAPPPCWLAASSSPPQNQASQAQQSPPPPWPHTSPPSPGLWPSLLWVGGKSHPLPPSLDRKYPSILNLGSRTCCRISLLRSVANESMEKGPNSSDNFLKLSS
jgi:hypothetical protein